MWRLSLHLHMYTMYGDYLNMSLLNINEDLQVHPQPCLTLICSLTLPSVKAFYF